MSGPAGALAHVARELVPLGRDRIARRSPVPRDISDVDAALLTDLLGRRVTSVEQLDGTAGTTDRVRLHLTGAGVPATVFVKMAPAAGGARVLGHLARLGSSEVGFYRDVRPGLDIEAPAVLGLGHDEGTGRFVVVLEDLVARGCTFTDTRTPLLLTQAEAAVGALAALHAPHWPTVSSASDAIPRWVRKNSADPLLPLLAAALPMVTRRLTGIDASLVPPDGRTLLRRYLPIARTLDDGPHTLLHGDPHPGNLYFADDRVGFLDWQVVRRGSGLRDVAYLLVIGLDETTRATHQRDLLDRYRHALADAGGPLLPQGHVWTTYRQMAAYAYVAAAITAGLGGLQTDDIAFAGLRRAAVAIDELGTSHALGHGEGRSQ